ncbi:MAG: hypothetical protein WCE21_03520 [Candidatus Babeliales bacterium]
MASYIHDLMYAWLNSVGMLRPAYLKVRLSIVVQEIKHLISNRVYLAIISVPLLACIVYVWPLDFDKINTESVGVSVSVILGVLYVWFLLVTSVFVSMSQEKHGLRYLLQTLSGLLLFIICFVLTLICLQPLLIVAPQLFLPCVYSLLSLFGFVQMIFVLAALSFFDRYAQLSNRTTSTDSVLKWVVPAYMYSLGQAVVCAFAQLPLVLVTIFVLRWAKRFLGYLLFHMHSITGFVGVIIFFLVFIVCFVCWLNTLRSSK